MKLWKHTLITAFAFLGISSTVLYTSCEKDSCADLKCQNRGTCVEGFCRCPSGYEGTECETEAAEKFLGRFIGFYTCPESSPMVDTVDIWKFQAPDQIRLVLRSRIQDTLAGTVNGQNLIFSNQTGDNYLKYTKAEVLGDKLTVFSEEVYD